MTEGDAMTGPDIADNSSGSSNCDTRPIDATQGLTASTTTPTTTAGTTAKADPQFDSSSMESSSISNEQLKENIVTTTTDASSDQTMNDESSKEDSKIAKISPQLEEIKDLDNKDQTASQQQPLPEKSEQGQDQKQVKDSSAIVKEAEVTKSEDAKQSSSIPSASSTKAPSAAAVALPTKEPRSHQRLRQGPVPEDVRKWLFRKEQLSYLMFPDKEKQRDTREVTCMFMQMVGNKLGLSPHTVAASIVYWQRYYAMTTVLRPDRIHIALAALLLASKSENDFKGSLKNIILCAAPTYLHKSITPLPVLKQDHAMSPTELIAFSEKEAEREKFNKQAEATLIEERNKVSSAELKLLCFLNFDFSFDAPYNWLMKCISRCNGEGVAKDAWVYTNDSFVTNVCLRFPPEIIACAALALAHEKKGLPFINPKTNRSWLEEWEIPEKDVKTVQDELKDLYNRQRNKNSSQSRTPAKTSSSTTSKPATTEKPKEAVSSDKAIPPPKTPPPRTTPSLPVPPPPPPPASAQPVKSATTVKEGEIEGKEARDSDKQSTASDDHSYTYRRERSHSHEHEHSGDERPPNRRQRRGSQEHYTEHHQHAPNYRDRDYNRDRERRHQRQHGYDPY